jgi:hypothetical protein
LVLPELGNFSAVTDISAYSTQVTLQSIQQNSRFTTVDDDIKKIITELLGSHEASQTGVTVVEGKVDEASVRLNALSLSEQEQHAKTRDLLRNQEGGGGGDDWDDSDDSDDVGYVPRTIR